MTRSLCSTIAALAVTAIAFLTPQPAWADSNKQPGITEVRADAAMVWLEIVGVNLGTQPPRVTIGKATNTLTITSATPTLVTALLPPGMAPGGYLLTFSANKNKSGSDDGEGENYDEFWVTIGAAGPVGAQGPAGQAGVTGLMGPVGAAGPMGPAGPAGVKGEPGTQGPTGPGGASGTPNVWARVDLYGNVLAGTGVTVTAMLNFESPSGEYRVTFPRDISLCAVVATASGSSWNSYYPKSVNIVRWPEDGRLVSVTTYGYSSGSSYYVFGSMSRGPAPFDIVATCP